MMNPHPLPATPPWLALGVAGGFDLNASGPTCSLEKRWLQSQLHNYIYNYIHVFHHISIIEGIYLWDHLLNFMVDFPVEISGLGLRDDH